MANRLRAMLRKAGSLSATAVTSLMVSGAPTTDAARVAEAVNQFALVLQRQLPEGNVNLVYSPYSISSALSMTLSGARGKTASQLETALHLTAGQSAASFATLTKELDTVGASGEKLAIANALWPQMGAPILPAFLQNVRESFHADARNLDYQTEAEAARQTINQWVSEHTFGKIAQLIPSGALGTRTRLVLTNAIYFKGNWETPFVKRLTREDAFYAVGDSPIPVPTMHQTGSFMYSESPALQTLELPYSGGRLGLIIVLPKSKDGIAAVEKSLTAENLGAWTRPTGRQRVAVSLPRFKVESSFELASALQKVGIRDAFTEAADFSGINGKKDLFVSSVIHKALIDVNEEGTEAAAATGVVMGVTSMAPSNPPVEFKADHPFLYFIRDRATGCVLFAGRVMNPKS